MKNSVFHLINSRRPEKKKKRNTTVEQNRASLTTSPHCNATFNKCAVSCSLINTINFHLLRPRLHTPFAVSFLHIVCFFNPSICSGLKNDPTEIRFDTGHLQRFAEINMMLSTLVLDWWYPFEPRNGFHGYQKTDITLLPASASPFLKMINGVII